jgi:dipeptidase D
MAIAEMKKRPHLELLFTVGEEVGLVGAHDLDLPITAPYALNLDWCQSDSIGIGCGGTLLMI